MIKFSHTIFALPFALVSLILVTKEYGEVTLGMIFWVIIAMIGARSASMGFNRYIDSDIDAANPRTSNREIPSNQISKKNALLFIIFFSAMFIAATYFLNDLCFYWSVPTLIALFFYSYTKRFSHYSHYVLGFVIGITPTGAWFAVSGVFNFKPILLSLTLFTYIAGFDILYSCQDEEYDRENGLFSIPVKYGREKALKISEYTHLITFLLFLSVGLNFGLNIYYYLTTLVIGILLILEHKLITSNDLSKIKIAFLYVNSIISVLFFISVLVGFVNL